MWQEAPKKEHVSLKDTDNWGLVFYAMGGDGRGERAEKELLRRAEAAGIEIKPDGYGLYDHKAIAQSLQQAQEAAAKASPSPDRSAELQVRLDAIGNRFGSVLVAERVGENEYQWAELVEENGETRETFLGKGTFEDMEAEIGSWEAEIDTRDRMVEASVSADPSLDRMAVYDNLDALQDQIEEYRAKHEDALGSWGATADYFEGEYTIVELWNRDGIETQKELARGDLEAVMGSVKAWDNDLTQAKERTKQGLLAQDLYADIAVIKELDGPTADTLRNAEIRQYGKGTFHVVDRDGDYHNTTEIASGTYEAMKAQVGQWKEKATVEHGEIAEAKAAAKAAREAALSQPAPVQQEASSRPAPRGFRPGVPMGKPFGGVSSANDGFSRPDRDQGPSRGYTR